MIAEKKNIRYLLAALATAFAPQFFLLPKWIVLWTSLLWGYAYWAEKKSLPGIGKIGRMVLAVIGAAGVFLSFRGTWSGPAYIGLLAIMSGLKVLEIKNRRDHIVTAFLAYFLVIASLFQAETLAMTLYMFFSVAVTTAVLIRINHTRGDFKSQLKLSFSIMLKAVPIMIALFFLFPRIESSFWGLAGGASGTTGFSDEMYPGSISSLVKNNEVAFRVRFDREIPRRESLYWRGVVLWFFDGAGWRKGVHTEARRSPLEGSSPVEYTVMLEPHRKKMLFTLDMPVEGPASAEISEDGMLSSKRRIRSLYRYRVKSVTEYYTGDSNLFRRASLGLPRMVNAKAWELARQWAEKTGSAEEIVEEGLKYFRENDFVYTLNPPRLFKDSIDGFLFETKKGYCEHFASSFAFLMRAAGVPARIVGGYQGGEKNPYGDYLIVRQSDAHAWVEVFLPNEGWTRVDPTAEAAPLRISDGVQEALDQGEVPGFLSLRNFGPLANIWKKARFSWDALNSQWDIWFVGYSQMEQRDFLAMLGFKTGEWRESVKIIVILLGFIAGCAGLIFLQKHVRIKKSADPVLVAYGRFCSKMAAAGIEKKPAWGPWDFARRATDERKELKNPVEKITDIYVRLRYAPLSEADRKKELQRLEKHVRKFDPRQSGKD